LRENDGAQCREDIPNPEHSSFSERLQSAKVARYAGNKVKIFAWLCVLKKGREKEDAYESENRV
jgi:hypothetical protein